MVADIFEDFEPPSKKFLATPLKLIGKSYLLVRVKEACGDAVSLEPILSLKKSLEGKLVVTNGNLWALLDSRTPHLFLLMIIMQNFILINNHIKPRA